MGKGDQLIQDLDEARQQMADLLAVLDSNRELYPGWTIKHVLAHIAGWDEASIDSLMAHAADTESSVPAYRGIDDYNAKSVATREMLNYDQVYREWQQVRDQLKNVLRAMLTEKFSEELLLPWGERSSVDYVIAVLVHHEKEHVEEIRQLLAKK